LELGTESSIIWILKASLTMTKAVLLIFLAAAVSVASFSPIARSVVGRGIVPEQSRLFDVNAENKGDFPPQEDEDTGSVDWDAEWKKVAKSEGKTATGERPGKDFYKSDAEIAAIKAANKAAEQASGVTSQIANSLPAIRSLSGDWKFWIATLVIVSVGVSLLSTPWGMAPSDVIERYDI
jgi:hypothetical protein